MSPPRWTLRHRRRSSDSSSHLHQILHQRYYINLTIEIKIGHGLKWDHRIRPGWFDRVVDRYQDESDLELSGWKLVLSRPTIYRYRTGTDRNGTRWDKSDGTYNYFKK
ncbi:hypothetical protein H5410_040000 [Solanum commersonii]|uniref:Uncharacterized protein n=1 Tax=Solanum commersonii TaxID=4109 RepID=A0A9J5XR91_SOLCO|nr:hypothetical protein H5410_040000 [Solanum commersonii]